MPTDTKIRLLQLAPVPKTAGMSSSEVAAAYSKWEMRNGELYVEWLKSHSSLYSPQTKQKKVEVKDEKGEMLHVYSAGNRTRFNKHQGGQDLQGQIDRLRGQLNAGLKILESENEASGFKTAKVSDAMPGWKHKRYDGNIERKPKPDVEPKPNARRNVMN